MMPSSAGMPHTKPKMDSQRAPVPGVPYGPDWGEFTITGCGAAGGGVGAGGW